MQFCDNQTHAYNPATNKEIVLWKSYFHELKKHFESLAPMIYKGGSVKPLFGTFLLCFNFLDFLWHRTEFQKWIFLWKKFEACQDLNGHQISAA